MVGGVGLRCPPPNTLSRREPRVPEGDSLRTLVASGPRLFGPILIFEFTI